MKHKTPRNILLVTPNAPWPPHTGSSQRSALLHAALSEIGTVKTICLQNPDNLDVQTTTMLEQEYGAVAIARRWGDLSREPWNTLSRFHESTAARLGNFLGASKYRFAPDKRLMGNMDLPAILEGVDLVVGRYTSALTCLGLLDGPIPSLIDIDDLDSAALRSQVEASNISAFNRWIAKRQLANVVRVESDVLKKASGLWIANPDEQSHDGLEDAHYLPNIPFYQPQLNEADAMQTPSTPTVGVIASFSHQPNVEAVDWFLSHVWPGVLAQVPTAMFNIYGSRIGDALKQRWSSHKGVDVIGFVENVDTAYAAMSVSVCPVLRGAGTNIKVLESAQFKRLCILTNSASRGLTAEAQMKDALIICEDANTMIEKIAYFLANPDATQQAAQKLHDAVEQHYSRTAFNARVHALVDEVLR